MVSDPRFIELIMRMAIEAAWGDQLFTLPNPSVGALVLGKYGEILSLATHKQAGTPHAEVLALKEAVKKLSGDESLEAITSAEDIHQHLIRHHAHLLEDCSLFVTLEPCSHYGKTPPCTNLIQALGIKEVFIASHDPTPEAQGGAVLLEQSGTRVVRDILSKEGDRLLLPFLRLRQKGNLTIFKWAQRLDGSIDGGVISSFASRRCVHALRSIADILVISGETVRNDRPTLDCRFIGAAAPDVMILTRSPETIDQSIPLFGVKNRQVLFASNPEGILEYPIVFIEGGSGLYESCAGLIDLHIAFIAPCLGGGQKHLAGARPLELLHTQQSGEDIMAWMA